MRPDPIHQVERRRPAGCSEVGRSVGVDLDRLAAQTVGSSALDAVALLVLRAARRLAVPALLGVGWIVMSGNVNRTDDVSLATPGDALRSRYPDVDLLLEAAADHATRLLVFSHPPRNLVSRFALGSRNIVSRLQRSPFRTYVHDPAALTAAARRRNLDVTYRHRGAAWHIVGLTARTA